MSHSSNSEIVEPPATQGSGENSSLDLRREYIFGADKTIAFADRQSFYDKVTATIGTEHVEFVEYTEVKFFTAYARLTEEEARLLEQLPNVSYHLHTIMLTILDCWP